MRIFKNIEVAKWSFKRISNDRAIDISKVSRKFIVFKNKYKKIFRCTKLELGRYLFIRNINKLFWTVLSTIIAIKSNDLIKIVRNDKIKQGFVFHYDNTTTSSKYRKSLDTLSKSLDLDYHISRSLQNYLFTIGSAKYLFSGKCFKRKLLNIFSNFFFFYLKVQSFRLIMKNNFIQMAMQ